MRVVNLAERFGQFADHWSPKIVGEVNDMHVKVVKLKGEFVWHHHEREDELLLRRGAPPPSEPEAARAKPALGALRQMRAVESGVAVFVRGRRI